MVLILLGYILYLVLTLIKDKKKIHVNFMQNIRTKNL